MKVGITCYPTYGGSGVIATELGKALAKRGHIVHFISYDLPGRLELNERIWFHAVETTTYPLFDYPPYTLALATKMADVSESENLDLLHVHYAIPHAISAFLAKSMLAPKSLPVITTLHGTDITLVGNDRSYLSITRFGIEKSDRVTAVSHYLKEATYQELNVKKEIEVVPNFVNVDQFRRKPNAHLRKIFAPQEEKILIHISNFRPVKRIADVIKVFDIVRKEVPARLLMIGDGPERSNAQYLCRTLKIENLVCFLGKHSSVEQFLSISDLLLLPSEQESFGLVALEAIACEVPVVGSHIGGLPELVTNGEIGYLAAVGDIQTMGHYALRILQDEGVSSHMRAKCRQRAVEVYNAKKIIPLYEKIYQDLSSR